MQPFIRLTGIAAPLPIANIDTDKIVPAAFLKTVSRSGLGAGLLYAERFDAGGRERGDFVLNKAPWRSARILIALDNFGCGSSREHAPWALLDFGISCVIAPSFADIFYANCLKNGLLPVRLQRVEVDRLLHEATDPAGAEMTVDLQAQTVVSAGGVIGFQIDAQQRDRLLAGRDEIADSLTSESAIAAHERQTAREAPWLAEMRRAPA
jgi:3-isopropylmalate/(R)-2-methylmalate dehydratase small subunit